MLRNTFLIIGILISLWSCKTPEARRPIQKNSGTFIEVSVERNKKIYEEEEKYIETIIAQDTTRNYFASENGFWYYYNVKDTIAEQKPVFGNEVTFTYNIKEFTGREVLSEEENGLQTYRIDQNNQDLISGIREGLKLMKKGEQITFLFPSYKAYGYYGIVDKLGHNIPITSTITLKTIKQIEQN